MSGELVLFSQELLEKAEAIAKFKLVPNIIFSSKTTSKNLRTRSNLFHLRNLFTYNYDKGVFDFLSDLIDYVTKRENSA